MLTHTKNETWQTMLSNSPGRFRKNILLKPDPACLLLHHLDPQSTGHTQESPLYSHFSKRYPKEARTGETQRGSSNPTETRGRRP